MKATTSHMLINEHPLMVLPSLAALIGLNEAVILQQVHFLMQGKNSGRMINGRKWIWKTFEEWRSEYLRFWSLRTIKTAVGALEKQGLLLSCQPDGRMSRKKYYSVDYDKLNTLLSPDSAESAPSTVQELPHPDRAGVAPSLTETTSETPITETTRKEGKSPSGKDLSVFVPPTGEEVQEYMNKHNLPVEAVRSWYFGNRDNGWRINGKRRIHDWRKALMGYVQTYKVRPNDPINDQDLQAFSEEIEVPTELYERWLEWGNRKGWKRHNPRTGKDEPIFDLKGSLAAFKEMVDNQY